jgi:hypothetical protein
MDDHIFAIPAVGNALHCSRGLPFGAAMARSALDDGGPLTRLGGLQGVPKANENASSWPRIPPDGSRRFKVMKTRCFRRCANMVAGSSAVCAMSSAPWSCTLSVFRLISPFRPIAVIRGEPPLSACWRHHRQSWNWFPSTTCLDRSASRGRNRPARRRALSAKSGALSTTGTRAASGGLTSKTTRFASFPRRCFAISPAPPRGNGPTRSPRFARAFDLSTRTVPQIRRSSEGDPLSWSDFQL